MLYLDSSAYSNHLLVKDRHLWWCCHVATNPACNDATLALFQESDTSSEGAIDIGDNDSLSLSMLFVWLCLLCRLLVLISARCLDNASFFVDAYDISVKRALWAYRVETVSVQAIHHIHMKASLRF